MLTGLILAGGFNRRMDGKSKALLPFGGEPLILRQIGEMRRICKEVIVVVRDPKPPLRVVDQEVRIITDYIPGKGPLSGMHAGFSLSRCPNIWVVGEGMPFLSAQAAELLLEVKSEETDAVLPQLGGKIHLLHGVYDKRCADKAKALLKKGEMPEQALLRKMAWRAVPESLFLERGSIPALSRSWKPGTITGWRWGRRRFRRPVDL
ncbi:molybdenum cofactor guanylyltransferase [Paenibacillus sp. P26]|nr:molybdenum cofactor guanylyltransferase [Paenibacillus sp. P26]